MGLLGPRRLWGAWCVSKSPRYSRIHQKCAVSPDLPNVAPLSSFRHASCIHPIHPTLTPTPPPLQTTQQPSTDTKLSTIVNEPPGSSWYVFGSFCAPPPQNAANPTHRPVPLPPPLPTHTTHQLFYSFFKKLVGKEVAVELKNDVELTGKLHSVDQYLNVKLEDVQVVKKERYPQLVRGNRAPTHALTSQCMHTATHSPLPTLQLAVKNVFIRGSVIRFIQLPASEIDVQLLQDSCRKDNASGKTR